MFGRVAYGRAYYGGEHDLGGVSSETPVVSWKKQPKPGLPTWVKQPKISVSTTIASEFFYALSTESGRTILTESGQPILLE